MTFHEYSAKSFTVKIGVSHYERIVLCHDFELDLSSVEMVEIFSAYMLISSNLSDQVNLLLKRIRWNPRQS
jgi:hypothetical protein